MTIPMTSESTQKVQEMTISIKLSEL